MNIQSDIKPELIAVVIPALNEAENLAWLLPTLVSKYHVIVVDNGSTDQTAKVAADFGAEVLHCQRRGYGSAVLTAFKHLTKEPDGTSSPDIVVVFDADGTSPAECIPLVCAPIQQGRADFVLAQRSDLERGAMPPHAKFGNWLATFLIHRLTGFYYRDMGPLRALKFTEMIKLAMHDPTWGWNVEMQVKAAMLGLRIEQIDIEYKKRRYGKSKISGSIVGSIRAGTKILSGVLTYYLEARRMKSLTSSSNAKS